MTKTSYWRCFRLIFVIFSLYLMGDAFYRWDGFRYYASFSDFLLSLALAAVFLTIITGAVTLLIWLPYTCLNFLSLRMDLHRQKELLFLFVPIFLSVFIVTWMCKRLLFPVYETSHYIKAILLFFDFSVSVILTWMLRNRFSEISHRIARINDIIQNRISPLVWLFGIFVLLSFPAVIYQTFFTGKQDMNNMVRQSVKGKNRPNIIMVTFDAMSAVNMSLYGYHRNTTPFISEWASTATTFNNAKAASNYTAPTTSSLITGKRVWTHLRFSRMAGSPPVNTRTESLSVLLKEYGYYNMAFMVNHITSVHNLGVAESFDVAPFPTEFMVARNITRAIHKVTAPLFSNRFKIENWFFQDGFITAKLFEKLEKDFDVTSYPPEIAFNRLITEIDKGEKPFFAWIHLNPPHAPYLPPEPYKGLFDNSGSMKTLKSQLDGRNDLLEYRSVNKRFPPEIETLRARYDEYIKYCDDQFKGFIEKLGQEGKLNNAVIILSTDHGEIFDHNTILHGDTLYEPETHIPLIIKEPGKSNKRVVDDLVEQTDIPATILDLAEIPIPSWMEGRSLLPLMRGASLAPRPVFAMNIEGSSSRNGQVTKGTIAVWDGNYKMIDDLENGEPMLFDLKKDPGELNNIITVEPAVGRRLLNLIHENLRQANERILREH